MEDCTEWDRAGAKRLDELSVWKKVKLNSNKNNSSWFTKIVGKRQKSAAVFGADRE